MCKKCENLDLFEGYVHSLILIRGKSDKIVGTGVCEEAGESRHLLVGLGGG